MLNVSYDVTRKFYKDVNAAFVEAYRAKTGQSVAISAEQARAFVTQLFKNVPVLASCAHASS